MSKSEKVVIIMPTYKEKDNVGRMLDTLEHDVLPQIKTHEMAILVADDNSPDGTGEIVKEKMKKWKNIALLLGEKKGLGAAYARAMRYAMEKMDAYAVIEFDADFQHDPHDIPRLVAAMDEGYDYIIGSRYVKGGGIPDNWGWDRKIKSRLGGIFARYMFMMFGIHDMTAGFKLTKTSFLKKVDLEHLYSYQFAYKLHILHDVVRMGAKVKEVPIIFYDRTEGKSKMDTNEMIGSAIVVLRLTWKDWERIIKFLIVGGSGFIVQLVAQEGSVFLGVPDTFAAGIGAEVAILSNFLWNHLWTFSDAKHTPGSSNVLVKLIKFNFTSLGAVIVQTIAVYLSEHFLGIHMHLFGLLIPTRIVILFPTIILIVIPMNYLIYNKFIWKTQKLKK